MTYPTTFATLAAGNQPLSLFDTMFQQVAAMIAIPCTISGTNSLTLTPITNAPTLAAYTQFCAFRGIAINSNTAPLTMQFTTLPNLPVYMADRATQVPANTVLINQEYVFVYDAALNSGSGGFILENAAVPVGGVSAGGSFANLRIANNAVTPTTQIDVSADELIMVASTGFSVRAVNQAFTINLNNVGVVNGLDTGGVGAGGFYFIFAISNGSTTGGLASRSRTAPTLPSGYNYVKRIGTVVMDLGAGQTSTVTITIASPAVVTWTANGLSADTPVVFSTTGSLPTGIVAGTTYYISPAGLGANSFEISATPKGPVINTSGTQSGTQTATVAGVRLRRTLQQGREVTYVLTSASATPFLPVLADGATSSQGVYSPTTPTWAAIPVGTYVPPNASHIDFFLHTGVSGAGVQAQVAPNNSYGGGGSANTAFTFPPLDTSNTVPTFWQIFAARMMLESTNIYWATAVSRVSMQLRGFTDNL